MRDTRWASALTTAIPILAVAHRAHHPGLYLFVVLAAATGFCVGCRLYGQLAVAGRLSLVWADQIY